MNIKAPPQPGVLIEQGAEGWFWKLHIDATWHGPFMDKQAAEDNFADWAVDQWRLSNNLSTVWKDDAA